MTNRENIAVTGATGQLGRLVVAGLRRNAPAAQVIGIVRNPAAAEDLAALGVELRAADYNDPASIAAALESIDKVLLISSNDFANRVQNHRAVIDAAKANSVKLLAYTSMLRADTTPMALAKDHRETEALIRASGVPFALLRNGWYWENQTANIAAALKHGAVLGAAKDGRISFAARADFAAAATAVLTSSTRQSGMVYELAGDTDYTLAAYAAEIAKQSGKPVVYRDLPEQELALALQGAGLPKVLAEILADSDAKAADGALYDDSRTLSRLIGRPTRTLAQAVAAALS